MSRLFAASRTPPAWTNSATADQRGETISSYFVLSYVAIAVPAIGVGFAAQSFGLYDAALAFAIGIARSPW
jgi:hypothetical protein